MSFDFGIYWNTISNEIADTHRPFFARLVDCWIILMAIFVISGGIGIALCVITILIGSICTIFASLACICTILILTMMFIMCIMHAVNYIMLDKFPNNKYGRYCPKNTLDCVVCMTLEKPNIWHRLWYKYVKPF